MFGKVCYADVSPCLIHWWVIKSPSLPTSGEGDSFLNSNCTYKCKISLTEEKNALFLELSPCLLFLNCLQLKRTLKSKRGILRFHGCPVPCHSKIMAHRFLFSTHKPLTPSRKWPEYNSMSEKRKTSR